MSSNQTKTAKTKTAASAKKSSPSLPVSHWYLGIDFGTTGISMALLHRQKGEIYPVYWEKSTPQNCRSFRVTTLTKLLFQSDSTQLAGNSQNQTQNSSLAATTSPSTVPNFYFKPYLNLGIAYPTNAALANQKSPLDSPAFSTYEPVLQWSDKQVVSLAWIEQALQGLFAALVPHSKALANHSPTASTSKLETSKSDSSSAALANLQSGAVGLSAITFQGALQHLRGVVLGCPADWSDAYAFNLREAVIAAGLVKKPEQIFMVEDSVAMFLSTLLRRKSDGNHSPVEASRTDPAKLPHSPSNVISKSDTKVTQNREISTVDELFNSTSFVIQPPEFQGGVLIINSGSSTTELATVDLPHHLQHLTSSHFTCHSFPYSGHALEQDIISHLLWDSVKIKVEKLEDSKLKASHLAVLNPPSLEWPRPGHPDLSQRYQVQRWLQSSSLGQALLEAAQILKIQFQNSEDLTVKIDRYEIDVSWPDFEALVLTPFVQNLNQELNTLLSQAGMSPAGINYAICTGGTGSWPALSQWLRQKLPNAIIIQDVHWTANQVSPVLGVACGLAALPLYPPLLNTSRQQYSDYFLLRELLRVFGETPLAFKEITQLLESRGINTRACQSRLLAILSGNLPWGLVPLETEMALLTPASWQNPDYEALRVAPLFFQDEHQYYCLNLQQAEHLRRYLSQITRPRKQKLNEPLFQTLNFNPA